MYISTSALLPLSTRLCCFTSRHNNNNLLIAVLNIAMRTLMDVSNKHLIPNCLCVCVGGMCKQLRFRMKGKWMEMIYSLLNSVFLMITLVS